MRRLRHSVQVRIRKSFRWVTNRKPKGKRQLALSSVGEDHDTIAIDAAMKLEGLAKMRLDKARTTFEVAAKELRDAEKDVTNAKKYTKIVKTSLCLSEWELVKNEKEATICTPKVENETEK